MSKFENATRAKYRFSTSRGQATVEDLWDLPLSSRGDSLDSVAKTLSRKLKETEEESFVSKKSAISETLTEQLELVKYIIGVKMKEAEERIATQIKAQQRSKITEILAQKEDEELAGKSVEDLQEMLKTL